MLAGAVEKNVFTARARKYDSVLESALAPNGIPTSVYTSLVETVRASLPRTMHKYAKLRRRLLHSQSPAVRNFQLHYWDVRWMGVGAEGPRATMGVPRAGEKDHLETSGRGAAMLVTAVCAGY